MFHDSAVAVEKMAATQAAEPQRILRDGAIIAILLNLCRARVGGRTNAQDEWASQRERKLAWT